MKKLNNKGITTIEVLLTFVLVAVISISLFSVISSYNDMRIEKINIAKVTAYKNALTKTIQDDLIMLNLKDVSYSASSTEDGKTTYIVDFLLEADVKRRLIIEKRLAFYRQPRSPEEEAAVSETRKNTDDYFMITYGNPDSADDMEEYPIPNLGSREENGFKVMDLSINNVIINIDSNGETKIFDLYIGFYHPELSTRYGISIVCPANYNTFTGGASSSFDIVAPIEN